MPITVQRIGTERDADGCWVTATAFAVDGALLVRPDGFVGWRADAPPRSPRAELGRVLCQILARTT
ncbi:hypothetical protein [Mycobacterium simiae]|uniref:Uncharacterized protein n=1 Tax=Mycobacterium simiae TaxID=1784 RepID=A0A1X0YFT6_MYCSI|nr:hypothetical protein [Mycobacterium simiae]ORJ63999.1 hypothetical protein B5M45_01875 [Mycobacterium simiae]